MPLNRTLIEEIEQESAGQLKIVKVDAAAEPEFTASFRVTAVPTVFLFRGGQRVAQFTGAKSKKDIKKWIDESIGQNQRV
jgi:thioredoxin 1